MILNNSESSLDLVHTLVFDCQRSSALQRRTTPRLGFLFAQHCLLAVCSAAGLAISPSVRNMRRLEPGHRTSDAEAAS